MRLAAAALALACLAGCATTPVEIRAAGRTVQVSSTSQPFAAANCAARNIEQGDPNLLASIRESDRSGSFEVIVRVEHKAVAVIESSPNSNGALLTMWNRPDHSDAFVAKQIAALKRC